MWKVLIQAAINYTLRKDIVDDWKCNLKRVLRTSTTQQKKKGMDRAGMLIGKEMLEKELIFMWLDDRSKGDDWKECFCRFG